MTRSTIQRLAFFAFLVCLAGSPLPVRGEPDPLALPESAIYPVPKKKPKPDSPQPQGPRSSAEDEAPTESVPAAPRITRETKTQPPRAVNEAPRQNSGPRPSSQQVPNDRREQSPATTQALTERVLTRKVGPEKVQQMLERLGSGGAAPGKGSPSGDWKFDESAPGTGVDDVPAPIGAYKRGTTEDGENIVNTYGSIPPGATLEGVATGLGEIHSVRYDRRFNAFILDDRAAYFMRIPPKSVAVLCRAIDQDDKERVGVGITDKKHLIYGKMPSDSVVAWDLKMADKFFGDIVFGQNTWSAGYRFVNGFKPQPAQEDNLNIAVFFNFNGFDFEVQAEEVRLRRAAFDVKLFPLSQETTKEGGVLPDNDAISQGRMPLQYEANARHLAENIAYYRRERIVHRAFVYGEVAAFLRALKRAGFDLEDLAAHIPGGKES